MTQSNADNHGSSQVPAHPAVAGPVPSTGLVVADQALLPATLPGWGGVVPAGPAILHNAFDPIWLLHSLRRHWVLATGLGLLFGLLSTAFVWWLVPAQATAVALLKVAATKPYLAFDVEEASGKEDYDTYRQTQMTYVTSHFVIAAALQRPGIAQLASLEDVIGDPVVWLQDELSVSFPREGEIMQIALTLEDGSDAQQLVDAVTTAYLEEIVFEDRKERRGAFSLLEKFYQNTLDAITEESKKYKILAKQLGQSESEFANVNQELALADITDLRKEREGLYKEALEAELAVKLLKVTDDEDARIGAAVEAQMEVDPKTTYLRQRLLNAEARLTEEQVRAKRPDAPSIQRLLEERQQLTVELARAQAELRRQARDAIASSPDSEYKNLVKGHRLRKAHYESRIKDLDQELEKIKQQVRDLAEQSAELETQKAQLEQHQVVATDIGSRLETWRVELDSPHRVRIAQPATVMEGLDWIQRYILIGLGGVFGFAVTCFGVAYWDFRHRRLNGPDQIDDGLGIRVVGTLPPLGFHGGGDGDPLLAMLMESIDSVRTTLMHADASKETRVVLVTSAAGPE
ncbi:MAG: hypothetical protein A2W31_02520, partial [Planctomycetes bacterium RBG_16_64_10]